MSLAIYMDVHVPAAVTVLFAPQGTPIGRMIEDAELCLFGLTADEFRNRLVHLPLR